ncbi:MAG: transglutaminase-like domain-containing protein [Oscillospiraceae bacterium]
MENTAETRFFSAENIKRKLLPFLFTAVFSAAVGGVYTDSLLHIPVMAVFAAALFALFDFIGAHKKVGAPIYIAAGLAVLVLFRALLSADGDPRGYIEWFLTGGVNGESAMFLWGTEIMFTFFISSVAYYFTHVIYRISILTVICFIPLALYVKSSQNIPFVYYALLAALDIFMYIYNYRCELMKNKSAAGKRAAAAAYIDFAAAAVLFALILPKPQVAPFYEKFEEFSERFSFGGTDTQYVGRFTRYSGNADNYLEMESRLLYVVSTNKLQYLKAQTFDTYDEDMQLWTTSGGDGYKNWERRMKLLNYNTLYDAYRAADSGILDKLGAETEFPSDTEYFAQIRAVDFPAAYTLSAERITGISFLNNAAENSYRTDAGEFFTEKNLLDANAVYNINYYGSDYVRESGWLESGLCDITAAEYGEYLKETSLSVKDNKELYDAVNEFYLEYTRAKDYYNKDDSGITDEIQRIADEITAGLEYDHQKAAAIERYFAEQGFLYDLAYRAPEASDTPEYFLTVSRRGTCSDFATAFCLLARASGLAVRYDEGFVPSMSENAGIYNVLTDNAHAFPEVFIPGAGWVIYEPTVGGANAGRGSDNDKDDGETDYLVTLITSIAVFISIAVVVIIIILMPRLEKLVFAARVRFAAPEKGIILIYGRLAARTARLFGVNTANMTAEQLSDFIYARTDISMEGIILPFTAVCYGERSIGRGDSAAAYNIMKVQLKALKAYKRRKKN